MMKAAASQVVFFLRRNLYDGIIYLFHGSKECLICATKNKIDSYDTLCFKEFLKAYYDKTSICNYCLYSWNFVHLCLISSYELIPKC